MTGIRLNAQNFCGTAAPSNHAFSPLSSSATSTSPQAYSLPIHFYIITDQGKLPGFQDNNYNIVKHIREALNFTNAAFATTNISFYPSGFTYHESSSLFGDGLNLTGLYNAVHDDDAINVYWVNNAGGRSGVARLPIQSPPNNTVAISAASSGQFTYTLAHELGHYFNLLHTFDLTSIITVEMPGECSTKGDRICDTNQELNIEDCSGSSPTLDLCVNCSSCSLTEACVITEIGITKTYYPNKKNIMNYYTQCYPDHFTAEQKQKMYNELITQASRAFLIQGANPPAVSLPAENGYVYRTVLSSTGSVTNVSQFGDMNVQLSKTGVAPVTSTTPSAGGAYIVDKGIFLPQNTLAKIAPTRNGSGNLAALNGVSSLDLIKVQRHILGIEFLPKPYARIAADVNNNGVISTTDQFIMQQLILNTITAFSNVPSWRMVPAFALQNSVFLSEFNNDPFSAIWTTSTGEYLGYNQAITGGTKTYFDDLEINLTNPNINQSSTFSFQAIKSGDVNFSAIVNSASTFRSEERLPDLRTDEKYRLQPMESSCLESGKSYSVSIAAKGDGSIYAYQMGLKFDPKLLQVSGVDRGDANFFSLDNYNIKNLKEGELKTVWLDFEKNEKIKINEKKDLFRMIAIPQAKVCDLSQVFQLNDQTLENLFYDENGRLIDLELIVTAQELKGEDSSNDLLLNVFPNPTSGEINFELKLQTKTKVEILLRDNFGKALTLNRTLEAGTNRLTMNEEISSLSSGIIYYTLKIGAKLYTGTFFKL